MKKILILALIPLFGTIYGQTQPIHEGVEINDVVWATSNVDRSGRFAATPGEIGRYYQFNSSRSCRTRDRDTVWKGEFGSHWDIKRNNPCPEGWRLPTTGEFESLVNSTPHNENIDHHDDNSNRDIGVWKTEFFENGYVFGYWLGPNALKATPKNPGQAIFLPYVFLEENSGNGGYWTGVWRKDHNLNDKPYKFITKTDFGERGTIFSAVYQGNPAECLPIRCVKR